MAHLRGEQLGLEGKAVRRGDRQDRACIGLASRNGDSQVRIVQRVVVDQPFQRDSEKTIFAYCASKLRVFAYKDIDTVPCQLPGLIVDGHAVNIVTVQRQRPEFSKIKAINTAENLEFDSLIKHISFTVLAQIAVNVGSNAFSHIHAVDTDKGVKRVGGDIRRDTREMHTFWRVVIRSSDRDVLCLVPVGRCKCQAAVGQIIAGQDQLRQFGAI